MRKLLFISLVLLSGCKAKETFSTGARHQEEFVVIDSSVSIPIFFAWDNEKEIQKRGNAIIQYWDFSGWQVNIYKDNLSQKGTGKTLKEAILDSDKHKQMEVKLP